MDSIIDGTLPCLAKLPWLTQQRAANLNADFQCVSLVNPVELHPLTPLGRLGGVNNNYILNGPFWWRLYRCSDTDVDQLNFYNSYKQTTQPAEFPPPQAYSYGVAIIVGANEVYSNSRAPLDYAAQKAQTARMFADASPQFILSLAREPGNGPVFAPVASTYNRIATPTVPVLIMDATLDSNTFYGNGLFTKNAMGENATLVTVRTVHGLSPIMITPLFLQVPWAWHGTLDPTQPCAASIIVAFITAFGADPHPNTTCLQQNPVPDYDGVGAAAKARSLSAFGTENLWNDDPPIPPFPPTPSPGAAAARAH